MGYANQGLNIALWHSALAPLVFPTSKLPTYHLSIKQGAEMVVLQTLQSLHKGDRFFTNHMILIFVDVDIHLGVLTFVDLW